MRQSQLFGTTSRHAPKDEQSSNACLLEQSGYISKLMSGVYSYLPLGWLVIGRINSIIRQEMDSVGGQEMNMPSLHPRAIWEATNRWSEGREIMYQFKDHSGHWVGLGWTHEEIIASIAKSQITSYRDLPLSVYQIQTKFRNEPRAKSGLIRCREFIMKDLYSFHADEAGLNTYYDSVKLAYHRIFSRCGLKAIEIEASGGAFSKSFSHEFQVISPAGEDTIIYCEKCSFAQNSEIDLYHQGDACPRCKKPLLQNTGIEVGNTFKLGTKFSEALGVNFTDDKGLMHPVLMASYGIGPGRVMGTIVEVHHDSAGIVWPESVAPFHIHLLRLTDDSSVVNQADEFAKTCQKEGIDVLYDDRPLSPGKKLNDSDLIGIPFRVIISPRTSSRLEIKCRSGGPATTLPTSQAIKYIMTSLNKNHHV